jgi:hypothetical protein
MQEDNMRDIEILKSFVSGEMPFDEFEENYFSNHTLQDILQDKLPKYFYECTYIQKCNNNIVEYINSQHWRSCIGQSAIHSVIDKWLKESGYSIVATTKYKEKYSFLLDVKPDFIDGEKAEVLVDNIINSISEDMPKIKRIKAIKEKIKEAFYLNESRRPNFPQDIDWPFSKTGKPLKYISRHTDGDLVQLTFQDMETGEFAKVEDYY